MLSLYSAFVWCLETAATIRAARIHICGTHPEAPVFSQVPASPIPYSKCSTSSSVPLARVGCCVVREVDIEALPFELLAYLLTEANR